MYSLLKNEINKNLKTAQTYVHGQREHFSTHSFEANSAAAPVIFKALEKGKNSVLREGIFFNTKNCYLKSKLFFKDLHFLDI